MRSKQQPRPSYRWLNKTDENDEGDENVENSEQNKDGSRPQSGSDSPSSVNSLESNEPQTDGTAATTIAAQTTTTKLSTEDIILTEKTPSSKIGTIIPVDVAGMMLNENDYLQHRHNQNRRHSQQQHNEQQQHQQNRQQSLSPDSPLDHHHQHHHHQQQQHHHRHHHRQNSTSPPLIHSQLLPSSNNNLIDSNDDVEHRIPATLIQDPCSIDREMTSPRCLSRESSRCPSDESIYSSGGRTTMQHSSNAVSPVAINLPATLPPTALLPQQSAAMAAYLNAAAAAAAAAAAHQQQNRLLAVAAAGLNKSISPPLLPLQSPLGGDTPILDFSTKRSKCESTDENSDSDAVNLTKPDTGPLDLSCGTRKRNYDDHHQTTPVHSRKISRSVEYKPAVSSWQSPAAPSYMAAAAAVPSPKNPNITEWNGKNKMSSSTTNDATKALEKMQELSRLGGDDHYKSGGGNSGSSGGRHSAWQSHWLNKGADSAKDVLKCVWCKQSFPTLAAMSTHMKETKHCNVSVPPPTSLAPPSQQQQMSYTQSNTSSSSNSQHQQQQQQQQSNKPSQAELNLLIKETMPLPRKLVRGQDVWLGKGAEQTRQILKCMWCGQSFRSLAEMTSHMQQTQHYTNIISQEQIISWKSSETGGGGSSGTGNASGNPGGGSSSTVSAVFTCKVCDQAFNSLKDLSNHMVKNSHYKEHIMRSITESGGRRRQTREKRKKSLPVRKLLELERAQHEFKNGDTVPMKSMQETGARITCEKCGDKIDTSVFVEHIRQCVGGVTMNSSQKNLLKSALTSNSIISPDSVGPLTPNSRDGRKSIGEDMSSPGSRHISPANPTDLSSPASKDSTEKSSSPSVLNAIEQLIEKSFDTKSRHQGYAGNNQPAAPLGSSILKRLGIDESVDYTKPLIDPQTMNFLRSYHQHHGVNAYGRRERSGSESSSVSERGSSRLDSLTPERKTGQISQSTTPRTTPDKINDSEKHSEENNDEIVRIKKEPNDDDGHPEDNSAIRSNLSIKREMLEDDDHHNRRSSSRQREPEPHHHHDDRRNSRGSTPARSPHQSASNIMPSPIPSPASERSVTPRSTTPRSTPGISDQKKPGGSLGALSSMFDNLTGSSSGNSSENHGVPTKNRSSHPLAALQKLCDKTETSQSSRTNSVTTHSSSSSSGQTSSSGTTPGAMLAFSWACNDAVTSDSIMKCAFCDTPFISKGAYRHHLSKMHFVKDDALPDPVAVKSQKQMPHPPQSPKNSHNNSGIDGRGNDRNDRNERNERHERNERNERHERSERNDRNDRNDRNERNDRSDRNERSDRNDRNEREHRSSGRHDGLRSLGGNSNNNNNDGSGTSSNNGVQNKSPPPNNSNATNSNSQASGSAFEESPHSKFLKYTELAKQLSSKYV